MTDIKRYEVGHMSECDDGLDCCRRSPVGEIVTFKDHSTILAAKDARIAELASREQWHSQRAASFDTLNRKYIDLQEQARELAEFKDKVRQSFLIGDAAEDFAIFINIENTLRRSGCLSAVEREFFTREEPDEEYPDEMFEHCDLSWGAEPKEYIEDFRKALREIRAQAVEVFAEYIAFYHSDSKSHVLDYAARIRSGEQPS